MPTEHPTIRCPKCGAGAIDVAPDYDPFQPPEPGGSAFLALGGSISIQAHCASGHLFFQRDGGGERESVAVGTPEWDDRGKRMEA